MSNDIAITSQPGATVGTAAAIFSPEGMDRLVRFATLMADSKATVPAHRLESQLIARQSLCRRRSGE